MHCWPRYSFSNDEMNSRCTCRACAPSACGRSRGGWPAWQSPSSRTQGRAASDIRGAPAARDTRVNRRRVHHERQRTLRKFDPQSELDSVRRRRDPRRNKPPSRSPVTRYAPDVGAAPYKNETVSKTAQMAALFPPQRRRMYFLQSGDHVTNGVLRGVRGHKSIPKRS